MGMPGPCSKSSYDIPKKYLTKIPETYQDLEPCNDYSPNRDKRKVVSGNPDPKNFSIMKHLPIGDYLIVLMRYPDSLNFEGYKVLVYKELTIEELRRFKTIDPHFSNSTVFKSPIARFVPTNDGWDMATQFCLTMNNRDE